MDDQLRVKHDNVKLVIDLWDSYTSGARRTGSPDRIVT
jgi:hypothetical protein